MRVLLDTHAFLWAVMEPERLSSKARLLLEDPAIELLVSAASAWEIATKCRLKKLPEARPIIASYENTLARLDAQPLPITTAHALRAGGYRHAHRDPFDRMLAAQAHIEGVPLVSRDRALRSFGIELVW